MNQQHRRLPTRDRRYWRRLPRHIERLLNVRYLLVTILEQPRCSFRGPVMDAMYINSRSEELGIACERKRRQKPAVRPAINPDSLRIDLRQPLQILSARLHVLILRRALRTGIRRPMKVMPVANSQTIVD